MQGRPSPQRTTTKLWRERFPNALALFCSGSVVRGNGTAHSDLDIVVLLEHVEQAYRESLVVDDWPVELFVHDLETLEYFVVDDCKAHRPSLATMLAQAIVIPAHAPQAVRVQAWAQVVLAHPYPLTVERKDDARYFITDLLDDLRDHRPRAELVAIASKLYSLLGEFILTSNAQWSASGKHLPRTLRAFDAGVADSFNEAFDAVFQHSDPQPLIAFAESILRPAGGSLFAGYRSEASPTCRGSTTEPRLGGG